MKVARTPWNKGKGIKKYCSDCKELLPTSSRYLPVKRCKSCYVVSTKTNFVPHPNSLKALRPKSAEWLRQHRIHLGHKHSDDSLRKISENRKGKMTRENNWRWSGGERITSNGYRSRLIETGKPHKAEHRIIMERTLGRELRFDEVVHHIDHDKLNNSVSNLIVISRSEHSSLHTRGII